MKATYRDLLRHIYRGHTRILREYERDGRHVSALVDLGWAAVAPGGRGWVLTDAGRAVLDAYAFVIGA